MVRMEKLIYIPSTCWYGKLHFPLTRGIKEGCPLSPAVFVLVYETFQPTLAKEFPEATFFVYVDDIVVVTKNASDPHRVLKRVQQLFSILGFQTNPGKIEVYKCVATPGGDSGDRHHTTMYSGGMARTSLRDPPYFGI